MKDKKETTKTKDQKMAIALFYESLVKNFDYEKRLASVKDMPDGDDKRMRMEEIEFLRNLKETLKDELDELKSPLIKIGQHSVKNAFGNNRPLKEEAAMMVERYLKSTGMEILNRPASFGYALNDSQNQVLEGVMKALTDTRYQGDRMDTLEESFSNTTRITKSQDAMNTISRVYANIPGIPVIRVTQAELIRLAGYDNSKQVEKQNVVQAINELGSKQFLFYWERMKIDKGEPVFRDGQIVKEDVYEVSSILRVNYVKEQNTDRSFYEICPSAAWLDQVDTHFLLVPFNWRNEVKQLTGKTKVSKYTYTFLYWLRFRFEQIRNNNVQAKKTVKNKDGTKRQARRVQPYEIEVTPDELMTTLNVPEVYYRKQLPRIRKVIDESYDIALKLGYLKDIKRKTASDILCLNEEYYPRPGLLT